jgi:hypothetical protein
MAEVTYYVALPFIASDGRGIRRGYGMLQPKRRDNAR